MSDYLPSIDLKISEKLRDHAYRQEYFLAESSLLIAQQLIALRKRRGLNQTEVANILGTGQPAISRVERADYRNWSFNTLRRLAEAMDARLRVYIEPAEDVLREYEIEDAEYAEEIAKAAQAQDASEQRNSYNQKSEASSILGSVLDLKSAKQYGRAPKRERQDLSGREVHHGAN